MGFGIYDSQSGGNIFMSNSKTKGLFHLELNSNVLAIRPEKILPLPRLDYNKDNYIDLKNPEDAFASAANFSSLLILSSSK